MGIRVLKSIRLEPFNLKLWSRITLINGDSATGKSYLFDRLCTFRDFIVAKNLELKDIKSYTNWELSCTELSMIQNLISINAPVKDTDIENLKIAKGSLILIDNGDILLRNLNLCEIINQDTVNQYLISSRFAYRLQNPAMRWAELRNINGEIKLYYASMLDANTEELLERYANYV